MVYIKRWVDYYSDLFTIEEGQQSFFESYADQFQQPAKLLNIECGPGLLSESFADKYDITVLDQHQEFIDIIKLAQDKDGYLNTYYTIKDQDKRWTNLLEGHELYCAGHMLEAACAYYEGTGKKTLLDVMIKNVKHIYSVFMEEKVRSEI